MRATTWREAEAVDFRLRFSALFLPPNAKEHNVDDDDNDDDTLSYIFHALPDFY